MKTSARGSDTDAARAVNTRDLTSQFCLRSTAVRACGAVLIGVAAAAAAADEPTTNLNNMVVTPHKPAISATATASDHVMRATLNLKHLAGAASPASLATPAGGAGQLFFAHSPPQPLRVEPPTYPEKALKAGTSGAVTVAFTVQPNGRTADVHVVKANPSGVFDRTAVDAVRRWRFRPAERNGRPVAAAVTQTLQFKPPAGAGNRSAVTRASAPDTVPVIPADIHPVHIVAPAYPPNAYAQSVGGSVTVEFVVATDGKPTDVRVLAAQPQGLFEHAALDAVKQWRFEPVAIPTRVVQTISFKPSGD